MTKIALVTGAGSGIGRASALALNKAGFTVVLAGRRAEELEKTRAATSDPARAVAVPTDVADEASVKALFADDRLAFRPARSALQQRRHRARRPCRSRS